MIDMEMKKPPLYRVWAVCKKCEQKLFMFEDNISVDGIYIKCKKCKNINKIKIENGKQFLI